MREHTAESEITVNDQFQLTSFRPSDQAALVRYLNDQHIYDCTLRIPFPYAAEDAEQYLEFDAATTRRYGHPVHFAIRDRHGDAIGSCGVDDLVHGHHAEIGYWLARPYWGRGIMTEVVGALCRHAQTQWKLVRIEAHVFEFNQVSARVLEKNGFELEGILRKHRRKDGRFLDSKLYALVQ